MFDEVRQKITRLMAAYAALEQSTAQNDAYKQQIIELERQIDNQKLAGAFLSGNNAESKKKIDKLIKEIDKCITLIEG